MRVIALMTALAGVLWISAGAFAAAHAKDGVRAITLEKMCKSEAIPVISSCLNYIDGAIAVMGKICELQKRGVKEGNGLFALDLPPDISAFHVVDPFLDAMQDPAFRVEWGDSTADYAVFFAANELWPCTTEK